MAKIQLLPDEVKELAEKYGQDLHNCPKCHGDDISETLKETCSGHEYWEIKCNSCGFTTFGAGTKGFARYFWNEEARKIEDTNSVTQDGVSTKNEKKSFKEELDEMFANCPPMEEDSEEPRFTNKTSACQEIYEFLTGGVYADSEFFSPNEDGSINVEFQADGHIFNFRLIPEGILVRTEDGYPVYEEDFND